MSHPLKCLVVGLIAAWGVTAFAQKPPAPAPSAPSSIERLGRCLADSTSGKDRKDLARWIFLSMSIHPEIRSFSSADAAAGREASDRTVGALFTRLLTETCAAQTRTAFKEGGTPALQTAFQSLGQLAMQEITSDPAVAASLTAFERHLDRQKLQSALNDPARP